MFARVVLDHYPHNLSNVRLGRKKLTFDFIKLNLFVKKKTTIATTEVRVFRTSPAIDAVRRLTLSNMRLHFCEKIKYIIIKNEAKSVRPRIQHERRSVWTLGTGTSSRTACWPSTRSRNRANRTWPTAPEGCDGRGPTTDWSRTPWVRNIFGPLSSQITRAAVLCAGKKQRQRRTASFLRSAGL